MKDKGFVAVFILGVFLAFSIGVYSGKRFTEIEIEENVKWIYTINLLNSMKADVVSLELVRQGELEALKKHLRQGLSTGFQLLERENSDGLLSDEYFVTSKLELNAWRSAHNIDEVSVNNKPMKVYSELFPQSGAQK